MAGQNHPLIVKATTQAFRKRQPAGQTRKRRPDLEANHQCLNTQSPDLNRKTDLKNAKDNDLSDRPSAAAEARAALLQIFRAAKEAADAAARAEADGREKAAYDRVFRVIKDENARKAARDLRYANRKARQKSWPPTVLRLQPCGSGESTSRS